MRKRTLSVILPVLLILSACGQAVPQEKAAYVGEWRAQTMALLLTQDGPSPTSGSRAASRPVSTARCAGPQALPSSARRSWSRWLSSCHAMSVTKSLMVKGPRVA